MTAYDLRAAVVDVIESSSLTDPGEIADKVLENVPARFVRAALGVTLRAYVRTVIWDRRTTSQATDDTQRLTAAGSAGTPGRSLKREGIAEAWRRHLYDPFCVDGTWKKRHELTYDDLMVIAKERRLLAERNIAVAVDMEATAQLLVKHKARTFGDLPEQVQAEVLS